MYRFKSYGQLVFLFHGSYSFRDERAMMGEELEACDDVVPTPLSGRKKKVFISLGIIAYISLHVYLLSKIH
jgi:hypothetical protein